MRKEKPRTEREMNFFFFSLSDFRFLLSHQSLLFCFLCFNSCNYEKTVLYFSSHRRR